MSQSLTSANANDRYPPPRSLNLNPEDWFWATWRPWKPRSRPEAVPFDLEDACTRLAKIAIDKYGRQWNWSQANISVSLSREEAHFWFFAMLQMLQADEQFQPQQLAEQLATRAFTGMSLEEVRDMCLGHVNVQVNMRTISPEICIPLANLLPLADAIALFFVVGTQIFCTRNDELWRLQNFLSPLTQGFHQYILPYLTASQIVELRQQVQSQLELSKWPAGYYVPPSPVFYLAAYFGCPNLRTLVESWADNQYRGESWHDYYHRPQEIIFGLDNPHLVEAQMRRLKLRLKTPVHLRAWLAHTEYSALDYIRDSILTVTSKDEAASLLETLALVKAPEAAPFMLELMLTSRMPRVARQWLEENPAQTIAGLIPVAAGRGRLAEAAIEWLRSLKRKGYATYIQTCLDREAAVGDRVRAVVLDLEEKEYIAFDSQTTPEWLQQGLATPLKLSKKLSWSITPADLPPIAVGDYRLNDGQVETVLAALRQSKLDSPHPLIETLKAHADRPALDAFAWKLFESWLMEGAPSKENWAMMAVGLLGSDTSALKLAPSIRVWPGESQHQRAVLGLECLRAIGTDTALMQINGIAQKVKFKGLKAKAQDWMEQIAQSRSMTREQLADRIVPDCDLDDRGSRLFDFGSHQFRFVLGPDMKPMIKDADGKVKSDLPKPGAKDDREKAEAAVADWKLLKKQVSEVVKVQSVRLEQAMVTGRRWQVDEFTSLLVRHPLMTNLTQRLIWGGYATGTVATFRVTEDRTYADVNDEPFELTGIVQVGIIHPLHLPADLRASWGEMLSDYEIVQPFVQLGRPLHALEPGEVTQTEITRFEDIKVPVTAFVGTLEKQQWIRGPAGDAGVYSDHWKPFSGANVTAVVQYYGAPMNHMEGWDDQSIERCFFLPGIPTSHWYPDSREAIPLGEIDPVVISEVLGDLMAIAAKAQ